MTDSQEEYDKYYKNFDFCFKNFQIKNGPVKNEENNNIDKKDEDDKNEKDDKDNKERRGERGKDEENQNDKKDKSKEKNDEKKINIDTIITKLKRLIAIKTHPDKVKGKEEVFQDAIKAFKENDIFTLLYIADSLDIKIKNIYDNDIYTKFIKYMEDYNKHVVSTYSWMWFESPEQRNALRNKLSKIWNAPILKIIEQEKKFELYKIQFLANMFN